MDPAIPYGKVAYDPARYLAIRFTSWERQGGAPLVNTPYGDIGAGGGVLCGIEFIDVFGKKRIPTIAQKDFSSSDYDSSAPVVPVINRDPARAVSGQLFQFPSASTLRTIVFDFGVPRDIREIRTTSPIQQVQFQASAGAGVTDLRARPDKIWRANTLIQPNKAGMHWIAGLYGDQGAESRFSRSRRVSRNFNPSYPDTTVIRPRDRQWLVALEQDTPNGLNDIVVYNAAPVGAVNDYHVDGGVRGVIQGANGNQVLFVYDDSVGTKASVSFQIPGNEIIPTLPTAANALFWFQGPSLTGITLSIEVTSPDRIPGILRAFRSDDGGRTYVQLTEQDTGAWATGTPKTFNW